MPGRKKVEIIVSFECDEQEDVEMVTPMLDQVVGDVIPSAWAVWSEVIEEEEI